MKATARRTGTFTHQVELGGHEIGGEDRGPNPQQLLAASLASCTAITIEMYAKRKGWDVGQLVVDCEYEQGERGDPTEFKLTIWLPDGLSDEQVERLNAIGAKCPVHRTLEGEIKVAQSVAITARQ
jgi:putative redox protein